MRQLFAQTAEKILSDNLGLDASNRGGEDAWPDTLWNIITESGLTLALVREESGGTGASFSEVFPTVLAAGKYAAPIPMAENMLANYFLDLCGIEIPNGITTVSQDILTLSRGQVSGRLRGVPWGIKSDHILCLARHGNVLHFTLVASEDAASTVTGKNIAQEPRDSLTFDMTTPRQTAALPLGMNESAILRGGALMRSAQIAGALETITNMTSQYASEREQFGRPIAKFQAIQQMIAQLAEKSVLSYTSADRAFHEPTFAADEIAIPVAKQITSEAASDGASFAHSVHGAIGFTHEYHLHYYSKRLWSWRAEFGTATYWADILGGEACQRGAGSLWPAITQSRWA
ncbi:acyl-CoA dehydrogenase family protein [Litorimonas sp.]|uniref:acyl-CoA dehydrogenase family protein n=1 Tax=Litorimonas sp. TaxID=1892381 RepID=UPI003A881036